MIKGRSRQPAPAIVDDTGGVEGREEEGDCNLTPASRDTKVAQYTGSWLCLGHQRQMMPNPLHQQEVITTVSCQSL